MAKGDSIWEAAEGSKHLTDLVEELIQLDARLTKRPSKVGWSMLSNISHERGTSGG
jgi:hypothetical protein